MSRTIDGRVRRADLLHGDEQLLPWRSTGATIHDGEGMSQLLDLVLAPDAELATLSMYLRPANCRPEEPTPPEFPPSNLYFSVDPKHGVAAVALLAFDRHRHSHQWLPRGNAWRPDVAVLAMDPTIPYDTPFPPDAYITVEELRAVVAAWAWGGGLPPTGVEWREATEREVAWHWL